MQINTQIINNAYYEYSASRTYAKNNPESGVNSGNTTFDEMVAKRLAGKQGELTIRQPEMYESDIKTAPYQRLADENGLIVHKGVVFSCDAEKNQLCLGDTSDPNKCLMVALENGGTLMVNYENLDDLTKAITLFSPEDQTRIMHAITVHNMSKHAQKEIDDDKNSIGDSADEKAVSEEVSGKENA